MAGELQITVPETGLTLYAIIRNSAGQVYRVSTLAFETYNAANLALYEISLTEQGASRYYVGDAPALVADINYEVTVYEKVGGSFAEGDPRRGSGSRPDTYSLSPALYFADIQLTRDQANTQDEYTVTWYRNGTQIALASDVTSPTIDVLSRSGNHLITNSAMTQIASLQVYKYDATGVQRMTLGDPITVTATATIDGATRSWIRVIGRDS